MQPLYFRHSDGVNSCFAREINNSEIVDMILFDPTWSSWRYFLKGWLDSLCHWTLQFPIQLFIQLYISLFSVTAFFPFNFQFVLLISRVFRTTRIISFLLKRNTLQTQHIGQMPLCAWAEISPQWSNDHYLGNLILEKLSWIFSPLRKVKADDVLFIAFGFSTTVFIFYNVFHHLYVCWIRCICRYIIETGESMSIYSLVDCQNFLRNRTILWYS